MTDRNSQLPAVPGIGFRAATFAELFCMRDQQITPHSAGKVLSRNGDTVEIAVRCRKCRLQTSHSTSQLPASYQLYHIRVTGEDGPHLPDEFRPIPYVEEEFYLVGISPQDAHERASFTHSLHLNGHLTKFYIDGKLHPDERF